MKRAMNMTETISKIEKSRVIEFPNTRDRVQHEQEIETSLRDLSALVADLLDSGCGILLAEEPSTREAFDELRVKEAALRWILRVAKHSNGAVREKLWSEVEDAVAGLEKTAELLLNSKLAWPHRGSANYHTGQASSGWC